jgi:hypothetical protein
MNHKQYDCISVSTLLQLYTPKRSHQLWSCMFTLTSKSLLGLLLSQWTTYKTEAEKASVEACNPLSNCTQQIYLHFKNLDTATCKPQWNYFPPLSTLQKHPHFKNWAANNASLILVMNIYAGVLWHPYFLPYKPKITRYNTRQFRINSSILKSYLKRCTYIMTLCLLTHINTYYNTGINEMVDRTICTYYFRQYHRTGWPISHDSKWSVLAASTDCLIRVHIMRQGRLIREVRCGTNFLFSS